MSIASIWDYFFAEPLVELYKFQCGSKFFGFVATAEKSIRFNNIVYSPEYIVRTGLHYSSDYAKDTLTVTLPATNDLANLFLGGTPEQVLHLTIYRGGLTTSDYTPIWVGVVNGASYNFSSETYTCDLACETVASRMERFGLSRCYQLTCPHALYGTKCGIVQSNYASVRSVQAVNSFYVTVNGAADTTGYYLAGQVVKQDGSRRFIAGSYGNVVTLERSLNLSVGELVTLYPGCDKSRATCINKFGNGVNYGGFPWMPLTSPFTSTIG